MLKKNRINGIDLMGDTYGSFKINAILQLRFEFEETNL
jgi:hypothetical protein